MTELGAGDPTTAAFLSRRGLPVPCREPLLMRGLLSGPALFPPLLTFVLGTFKVCLYAFDIGCFRYDVLLFNLLRIHPAFKIGTLLSSNLENSQPLSNQNPLLHLFSSLVLNHAGYMVSASSPALSPAFISSHSASRTALQVAPSRTLFLAVCSVI